jgi:hypothetical protein
MLSDSLSLMHNSLLLYTPPLLQCPLGIIFPFKPVYEKIALHFTQKSLFFITQFYCFSQEKRNANITGQIQGYFRANLLVDWPLQIRR